MLAKLMAGVMDPARCDRLSAAVEQQLVPRFLEHDGADSGYWMMDRSSGRVIAITLWDDPDSMRHAAAVDGSERSVIADQLGLRAQSIQTLPVLAAKVVPVIAGDAPVCRSVRVTWVEGVAASQRGHLAGLYQQTVDDQAESQGFCGSYWLGEEESGEGCAVSLWERSADLAVGTAASRRRQRRLAKALGCRISRVHEYEVVAVADRTSRADRARRRADTGAFTG